MPSVTAHHTRFERNTITGLYRATCTCGWFDVRSNLTELQLHASTHDVAWQPLAEELEQADA